MFEKLRNLVKGEPSLDLSLSRNYTKAELDMAALLLKDNPDRQREFENLYTQFEIDTENLNLFQQNAAKVIDRSDKFLALSESAETLVTQIVEELVSQTVIWDSTQGGGFTFSYTSAVSSRCESFAFVTRARCPIQWLSM